MNTYVTADTIRKLREGRNLTQAALAEIIGVSSKTVSKWETAKGLPDITLLQPLAQALGISVIELMNGEHITNRNISANLLRGKFHVCPVCGNILHSMGEAVVTCHGVQLAPAQMEESDEHHKIFIEGVEDEYFVRIEHEMSKTHYISFVAALSPDRIQMVRLYPEGNAETRFQLRGVSRIDFYCNRDGLFSVRVHKAIDARPAAYDDAPERRALEEAAKRILG